MRWRRINLSPGDGGGAEGDGDDKGKQEGTPSGSDDQSKGKGPQPVPYDVFKETNEKLRAAEAEAAKLQAKLQGYEGWKAPKEVEDLLAQEKANGERLLLLADKGVAPKYRSYMLNRLSEEKPEDPGSFLDQLRESEAAFFGAQSTPTPPAGDDKQTPRTPPKSNPDGGAGSAAPGDGRPITAADIQAMSVPEYLAWKKAGGLDRLRASEAPS
jgi:hypothetical protein